jgi:hypothetical protein
MKAIEYFLAMMDLEAIHSQILIANMTTTRSM